MDPAKHDITIHQGATFELQIAYKDPSGVPINMSGYTIEGQLWNRLGTSKLADFYPSWTVQESGTFTIGLASSVTRGITENGQYDVMVTEPSGKKSYLLQGNAFIDLGLTGKGL